MGSILNVSNSLHFNIVKKLRNLKTLLGQRSKMQTTITNKKFPQILKGFETFVIHFGTFAKYIINGKRF